MTDDSSQLDDEALSQQLFLPQTYLTYLILPTAIILLIKVYQKYSKSKKQVNCWFCNKNQELKPNQHKNNFTCIYCEQYNGFTKDGDYNVVLAKQHYASLNEHETIKLLEGKVQKHKESFVEKLCSKCNVQFLKGLYFYFLNIKLYFLNFLIQRSGFQKHTLFLSRTIYENKKRA